MTRPADIDVSRHTVHLGGVATSYLEAGHGPPLVLLHGGEFGGSAETSWDPIIRHLAQHFRVVAPDMLGFGHSAKVIDFVDGRGLRIRQVAALCELLGIDSAPFVGNSMGGVNLLYDAAAAQPRLPASSIVSLCGSTDILTNEYVDALFEYDGTLGAMRRLVGALFHSERYADAADFVERRHRVSTAPGAWEAIAAARFKRPHPVESPPKEDPMFERITVPALIVEGGQDKLKPEGWAARLAARIPGGKSAVVEPSGHCPQIEALDATVELLAEFWGQVLS